MARKSSSSAATPKKARSDRAEILDASPELANGAGADPLGESGEGGSEENLELAPPEEAMQPRQRMSGEELKAHLRQQRREARLAEKGY